MFCLALDEKCGTRAQLINCRYVQCRDCHPHKHFDLGRAWNVSIFYKKAGHWSTSKSCGVLKDEREKAAAARDEREKEVKELQEAHTLLVSTYANQFPCWFGFLRPPRVG